MIAIQFDHVGKLYRLGTVGTGTLSHDLNRWWKTRVLHQEDPYLKIGETNDRATHGHSDYVWALKDISFSVEQGDVVGIIGKNGAGKSTLLKLLSQITSPTTGAIRARGRIGSLLEVGTGFHPEMTGRENIFMNGAIMGMTRAEITRKLDEIIDFAGVARYIDTPVKRYSSGMTVRLGFAVAAFMEPEILVVDEVLAVGDAEFQKKAIGKMQDVSKGEGRTVLFVSHNMDSVLNLCNNGILLENGLIKYSSDIKSTVSEYISNGLNATTFVQTEEQAKNEAFISSMSFIGSEENRRGLFSFADKISFSFSIKKKKNKHIDINTVVGVVIMTLNQTRICTEEIRIGDFEGERSFQFSYDSGILMPNKYMVLIAIHSPNVYMYDIQNSGTFTIFDNGTDFLKYNGVNNGLIVFHPNIKEY